MHLLLFGAEQVTEESKDVIICVYLNNKINCLFLFIQIEVWKWKLFIVKYIKKYSSVKKNDVQVQQCYV